MEGIHHVIYEIDQLHDNLDRKGYEGGRLDV